ncbi:MAG: hypothetical protein AABZ02_14270 [Bacteroidota bacterium]
MGRARRVTGALTAVVLILVLAGCSKSSNPVDNPAMQSVSLAVAFSKAGTANLGKTYGVLAMDSIRIDSAIVVFQRIKFESHIDSVVVDTSGHEVEDEREVNITFKGPFVVRMRDTMAINLANQMLPAGTYDGIKFKIHKLVPGEKFEDSDEHNNRPVIRDNTNLPGASIIVWGQVKKNGSWVSFTFSYTGEVEFKMKGSFTVSSATNTVNMVLRFDMGSWLRNPLNGSLLDPTDTSSNTRELINKAIRMSFEKGKGGHDFNRDGRPDDD